jgi:hypothetical protein
MKCWPWLEEQMALADLTHGSVEAALAEAEAIGREPFLAKYGFGGLLDPTSSNGRGNGTTARRLPEQPTGIFLGGPI